MFYKLSLIPFLAILLSFSSCCSKNNCDDFKPTGLDIRLENNFVNDSTFVIMYDDTNFSDTVNTFTILPKGYVIEAEYLHGSFFTIHSRNNTQVDTISYLQRVLFDVPVGCTKCPMQFDSPSPDSYYDGTWSGYLNGNSFNEITALVIP